MKPLAPVVSIRLDSFKSLKGQGHVTVNKPVISRIYIVATRHHKDRGAHFGLGGLKSKRETGGGLGAKPPEKFSMTTPSTLAINATNALFYGQTRLGKDSYHQHIQSLNQIRKHHLKGWTVLHSIFHSEKTQPRMKGIKLKKLSQFRGIIISKK